MERWRRRVPIARAWHLTTAAVIVASLGAQLVLVIQGENVLVPEGEQLAPTGTRVVNFFSYFTVQANILLAVGVVRQAINPERVSPAWAVVRHAGLIGIAVTGLVYVTLLRPVVQLEGLAVAANVGFHYLSPLLGVVGWALFDPKRRFTVATMFWSLVWPLAWLGYTLARGAVRDWYPYPFIDVTVIGYQRTLLNSLSITILMLGVAALFTLADSRLREASRPVGASRR